MEAVPEDGVSEKLGATPVPFTATACGLSIALSVKTSEARSAPLKDGINITLTLQVAPAARVVPQLLVWAKFEASALPIVTPKPVAGMLPEFVSVTCCAGDSTEMFCAPKLRDIELRLTVGLTPVPLSATICGLPAALSAKSSDAWRASLIAGVNTTLIMHEALAARMDPQLPVSTKLDAFDPLSEVTRPATLVPPVFAMVTC